MYTIWLTTVMSAGGGGGGGGGGGDVAVGAGGSTTLGVVPPPQLAAITARPRTKTVRTLVICPSTLQGCYSLLVAESAEKVFPPFNNILEGYKTHCGRCGHYERHDAAYDEEVLRLAGRCYFRNFSGEEVNLLTHRGGFGVLTVLESG